MAILKIWKDGHCTDLDFTAPALLAALLAQGGFLERHPCGGRGTCGKCAVTVTGAVSLPNEAELAAGTRLSCQVQVLGDAQVFFGGSRR